jgi:predicted flap endonuclease-1-like 5' DNA nuclease/chromosome segregation ATPase
MIVLISQIVGCLLIAAGIGGVVGWLLRQVATGQLTQQFIDATATLRRKEQMLEKTQYELKVQAAAMQILESKIVESEALDQSSRQELSTRHERIHALQEELAATRQRLSALESGQAALLARVSDSEASTIAKAQELQESNDARQAAQQALILKEQELLPSHEHRVGLEHHRADIDRLRTRIQELEPAQGRVHWLEVQLSERDTQHRTALHEVEQQLAERDQHIGELEQLHQQLTEREAAGESWKAKYTQAVQQTTAETARSQKIRTRADDLQAQLTLHEQRLREKDNHIATLQRHIDAFESVQREIADQPKMVEEKEEEISLLRKRLVEVRAALQVRTDGGGAPHPVQPSRNQLSLLIGQTKPSTAQLKDDLKEIRGIGPAFERVLNKLGIVTFQQVAQWDAAAMQQIVTKLATAPDRIKRDKWIVSAKKLHEQKYGERL